MSVQKGGRKTCNKYKKGELGPTMTRYDFYGLDEWFWAIFKRTSTWPNFTFGQLFMWIGANNYQIWLPIWTSQVILSNVRTNSNLTSFHNWSTFHVNWADSRCQWYSSCSKAQVQKIKILHKIKSKKTTIKRKRVKLRSKSYSYWVKNIEFVIKGVPKDRWQPQKGWKGPSKPIKVTVVSTLPGWIYHTYLRSPIVQHTKAVVHCCTALAY